MDTEKTDIRARGRNVGDNAPLMLSEITRGKKFAATKKKKKSPLIQEVNRGR